ncbi:MAG: MMPL family transporter [Candidatus Woesearchaeota archaeon]
MIIKRYSRYISHNPYTVLLLVLLVTGLAIYFSGQVGSENLDNSDMLPDDIKEIRAFDIIGDHFGGSDSIMIALELDSGDIRKPEYIEYMYLLSELVSHTDHVVGVTSAGTLVHDTEGMIPKSERRIKEVVDSGAFENYISDDYLMSVIRINLDDSYDDSELVSDLQGVIGNLDKPRALSVNVAGDIATGPIIEGTLGPDMQKTSIFSLVGILVVLLLLFRSIRYALTPLAVIIIGLVWAFGYFGLLGLSISPATSGAMSMIMGIGIDFGIQTISRFRRELEKLAPEKAMENTLNAVFIPMFTTTLAALIGFRAMSMGNLTVMAELGTMMSYGITACFLAAITIIPIISVLGERFRRSKK